MNAGFVYTCGSLESDLISRVFDQQSLRERCKPSIGDKMCIVSEWMLSPLRSSDANDCSARKDFMSLCCCESPAVTDGFVLWAWNGMWLYLCCTRR